jgi:hypothetical protein
MRLVLLSVAVVAMLALAPSAAAADTVSGTAALCGDLFGSTFGQPWTSDGRRHQPGLASRFGRDP